MFSSEAVMQEFPKNFVWGTATSSYQIEGGWMEGGKGWSIWDIFAHTPGKIIDGTTGDVACDHYHRYRDDVALMGAMGLKAYRFSIAWPRILPTGRGTPNKEGIRFYSDLLDALLECGIDPWITLYHWDLPAALQMELDGWLHPGMADHFAAYAALCFEHFGDRVKHWITFNEPWGVSILGHGQGVFAPGRVSRSEPYIVAHNILRAHGKAVALYRERFQGRQGGQIAMVNNCDWREPLTDSPEDKEAAERAVQFFLGWFADPLYRGDYPEIMRRRVGERLPRFSPDDVSRIRGSNDFFGLNHYTTMYASRPRPGDDIRHAPLGNGSTAEDQDVRLSPDSSWQKTTMDWPIVPWGFRKLLQWIHGRYDAPEIVVTESGCSLDDRIVDGEIHDHARIDFLRAYLQQCHEAIRQGVRVKGYFLWSFMDNYEWSSGFTKRFGLHYVDFPTGKRTPKMSAGWYSRLVRTHILPE
jgi:beta-glucosidase